MNRRPFLQFVLTVIGFPRMASATARPNIGHSANNPDFSTALEAWLQQPIQPVTNRRWMIDRTESEIITCVRLWDAIHRHYDITLRYDGGTNPGERRIITPALVFHKIDGSDAQPLYVLAWCHRRGAHRTFRLDRMRFETEF